jgi:hypothetical protein
MFTGCVFWMMKITTTMRMAKPAVSPVRRPLGREAALTDAQPSRRLLASLLAARRTGRFCLAAGRLSRGDHAYRVAALAVG